MSAEPRGDHAYLTERVELSFAVLCGFFLLLGWVISQTTSLDFTSILPIYLASYVSGGFFTLRASVASLRQGHLEIDLLMLVAALGAAALGNWAEGALLLFLFSISHSLEHYAMGRAKRAIEALAELAPDRATIRREGNVMEVAIDELIVGDICLVKPNERIAADGFVVKGGSTVDQSPITGEAIPVDKSPVVDLTLARRNFGAVASEHIVFAGTINQRGALEIEVTRLATESMLARVVTLVNQAQSQQSTTQRFAERFERYYVPTVLLLVFVLNFAWLVLPEPFSQSFYRAMAVLVGASPCALAISTPSAILSGVARAARGGVLMKGGGPLELLGNVNAIAFDKTGTLTEGRPRLTDMIAAEMSDEVELLTAAITVESHSDHPLAAAIVRDGTTRLMAISNESQPLESHETADNLRSITGRGMTGEFKGELFAIGSRAMFAEIDGAPIPEPLLDSVAELERQGRTTMIVRRGERYLGVLGMMDTPRDSARETIAQLRELGIGRLIVISGDHQTAATAVAAAVGVDEAWGDLMPEDKVAAVRRLGDEGGVAMVGDGVNDAPAMANADVGVAMGAAGSDVALETADVALMADNLSALPFAIRLSRQTNRIIRQNVWFSLGMIAVLVPSALFGLRMGWAVVLHEGSTLVVVLNALRLLAFPR